MAIRCHHSLCHAVDGVYASKFAILATVLSCCEGVTDAGTLVR